MGEEYTKARLVLEDGSFFPGTAFGSLKNTSGEVVFTTGMVGYPESMTDPSYSGQIVVFTYPLIGNYGVPKKRISAGIEENFESSKIHTAAIIINDYCEGYSHWTATRSLNKWMKEEGIPGIYGIDTRALTRKLREKGVMLGKIVIEKELKKQDKKKQKINYQKTFYDPAKENLVAIISPKRKIIYKAKTNGKKILLIDCGCKNNIIHNFIKRSITVIRVPWDYDFSEEDYDGIFISNGPGDPAMCQATINNIRKAMTEDKPIFGICLGNQILALAARAKTYKLKYGHRSQNQPCIDLETKRCYITSQNHGYAVDAKTLPKGWKPWFENANDGTNEGIKHITKPFMSVQFHPEATPGPTDTGWLFERFIDMLNTRKNR